MKKGEVKVLRENEQQIEKELILKEERVYVVKGKKLRVEIIQLYYNVLVARHRRKQKIIELVIRNYWQPEVIKNMKKYVNKCNMC